MLKLTEAENKRMAALRAGKGHRTGARIFKKSRGSSKITVEQLLELKEYKKQEWTNVKIQMKLNLSEYIVRLALKGHYDHILPTKEE